MLIKLVKFSYSTNAITSVMYQAVTSKVCSIHCQFLNFKLRTFTDHGKKKNQQNMNIRVFRRVRLWLIWRIVNMNFTLNFYNFLILQVQNHSTIFRLYDSFNSKIIPILFKFNTIIWFSQLNNSANSPLMTPSFPYE